MTISDLIQLVAVLTAIFGLIITISNFRRQMQLSFFADYTKRYQEIMTNLPETIYKKSFDIRSLNDAEYDLIYRNIRAYFDLCSEEYFLYMNNNIDKKTWKEWESGIEYLLTNTCFRDIWSDISFDTYYYHNFTTLIDGILQRSTERSK